MKKYVSDAKKLSMILEILEELDCTVYEFEYETGMLHLTVFVQSDDPEDSDDEDEDCYDDEEEACPDFEADKTGRCIHLCPECGKCELEDC